MNWFLLPFEGFMSLRLRMVPPWSGYLFSHNAISTDPKAFCQGEGSGGSREEAPVTEVGAPQREILDPSLEGISYMY